MGNDDADESSHRCWEPGGAPHELTDLDSWLSGVIASRRAEAGAAAKRAAAGGAAAAGAPAPGGVAGAVRRPLDVSDGGGGSAMGGGGAGARGTGEVGAGDQAGCRSVGGAGATGKRGLATIWERLLELRLALEGAHEPGGDESKRRASRLDDVSFALGPSRKKARTAPAPLASGVAGGGNAAGGALAPAWQGGVGLSNGCFALDRLEDYKISWKIHLFPGGFSIEGQNEAHPYDKTVKEFLTSLDLGLLPADVTLDTPTNSGSSFDYYDGCLVAEVRDHRLVNAVDLKPRVYRVLLRPDSVTVTNDLRHVWRCRPDLSEGDVLLLEKSMLLATQPTVCLDPHPRVGIVAASLGRRAQRCQVWHKRPARPLVSEHRREFDAEPLRRMNSASRAYRSDPLAQSKLARLEQQHKAKAWRANKNRLQQQLQMDMEQEERAERGIQAIVRLGAPPPPNSSLNTPVQPSPATPVTGKGKGKNAASGVGTMGFGSMSPELFHRLMPPPQQQLKGQQPERSMKFRKDLSGPTGKLYPGINTQVVGMSGVGMPGCVCVCVWSGGWISTSDSAGDLLFLCRHEASWGCNRRRTR